MKNNKKYKNYTFLEIIKDEEWNRKKILKVNKCRETVE